MLARHPITGKDVRIIQTGVSLIKETKTIFYGPKSEQTRHLETISEDLLSFPTYCLVLRPCSADELVRASKKSRIVVVSHEAFTALNLPLSEFKKLGISNMIYLHEIHLMYPHLGVAWDGTAEDAAILIAGLLRYNKIIGESFSLSGSDTGRAEKLGITVEPSEQPMRVWWITQYYTPEKGRRQRELNKALAINVASPLIDKIILLNEKPEAFPKSDKIEETVIGKRLSYKDVFQAISEFPNDVIAVFANADICIDDASWKDLWTLNLEDKFVALLRYDVPDSDNIKEAKLFGPRPDSQDTWAVRAIDVKSRGDDIWKNLDFQFGRSGCDNAIALEMLRQKFLLVNPALSLMTFHFHSSEIRSYDAMDILERPVFLYLEPTGIQDLIPVLQWDVRTDNVTIQKPAELRRILRGSGLDDWKRITKHAYTENSDNIYIPEEDAIFELGECFETSDGLAFDRKKMYIGPSSRAREVWNKTAMHGLMPTLEVERALIVPWHPTAERSREMYCLRYLSKVLRLWDAHGPGDFFAVQNKMFEPILSLFNWNMETLPVMTRDPSALVWAKSAVGFPVSEYKHVLKEDVDALRKFMRGWKDTVDSEEKERLVIVEDNFLLKTDVVGVLEESLIAAGWNVTVIHAQKTGLPRFGEVLCGARAVVCSGNIACYGWNWMLPPGASVFEMNGISTEGLELSSAAGLDHYIMNIIKSETAELVPLTREQRIKKIIDEINSCRASPSAVLLPTIWMPRASLENFFSHPGDSFREMVKLWAAAGYVNMKEHESATMVWWEKVGAEGTLLYDRPTNEWRLAAPEEEKTWRLALFGNPQVGTCENAVPWFFWPRRPSLVEELAPKAVADYDARSNELVFYGRVENAVQARRRQGDWESVCSEWHLVQGDTQAEAESKYPFTQSEYLERLSGAKFGLCLAGYGYKCHREIECMAMGCVPVVAADVDMDSYASAPVAGVHYLRVSSPEDVAGVLAAVTKEQWTSMSAACQIWWKENASCAGSFELTKRLISSSK